MRKRNLKISHQHEHSECGLACVSMLLNYYKINISTSELRDMYGVPKGGNNLNHLSIIFEEFGIIAKAYKIDSNGLMTSNEFPVICFWENKHFVVVESINKRHAKIYDPAIGVLRISLIEFKEKYSNIIMSTALNKLQLKETTKNKNKHKTLKNIFYSNKVKLLYLFMLAFISHIFTMIVPIFTQILIDDTSLIVYNIVLFVTIALIGTLIYFTINILRGHILALLEKDFTLKLMQKFMNKILKLDFNFFINRSSGDLTFRTALIFQIQQILSSSLINIIINFIFSIISLAIMFQYSISLTILTIVFTIVLSILSITNSQKLKAINSNEISLQSSLQSIVTELYDNIETIKSLGYENRFYTKWHTKFTELQLVTQKKNRFQALMNSVSGSILFLLPFLILLYGVHLITENIITIGQLIAFLAISSSFISPIYSLIVSYTQILIIKNYYDKINEILLTKIRGKENQIFDANLNGIFPIQLENISYKYSYFEKEVLSQISLTINESSKIAIVGRTGSGKSTLLKIISGLYSPTNGVISHGDNLSDKISYVNQSSSVFNTTIYENLFYGINNIDLDYADEILKNTLLYDLIKSLPMGLQTIISESGLNFSGGQIQQISIARSLIKQPELLLLDEPTSALDSVTENKIMRYLLSLNKPCVCVAHRLSTIKHFDSIIVMEKGVIVEMGTHEDLISKNGFYFDLYDEANVDI